MKNNLVEFTCPECSKIFTDTPRKRPRKFCSHQCARSAQVKRQVPALKEFECAYCKTTFSGYGNKKFCGHSCALKHHHAEHKANETAHPGLAATRAARWKGGRRKMTNGYISVWIDGSGYKYEHRVVMEKHLGRALNRSEIVHHIDGNRENNDISNLQVMSKREHDLMTTNQRYADGWKRK